MSAVQKRVDRLAIALERFSVDVRESQLRTERGMCALKDEMRQQNREMNRKWGMFPSSWGPWSRTSPTSA